MSIRPATRQDIPDIARVHVDTWRTTYAGILPNRFLAELSYESREDGWKWVFDYSGSHDGNQTFVAEDSSGAIVGFANGGPERTGDPEFKGELNAIYIGKAVQGLGIGRALTKAVVESLRARNLDSMIVWVLAGNPACGFYERLGGQRVREKKVEIGGRLVTEVAYGWRQLPAV